MGIRKRLAKVGLISTAVLLSSGGLSLATATPASAAGGCYVTVRVYPDGSSEKAYATSVCSTGATLYRKFVWNNGPDSICLAFKPGDTWTHSRPYSWSTFKEMKAC